MIDFPASPTTGQTFDPGTGIVYSYDGVAWNAMTTSTATARAKNLLINPAMMISQENGSTVVAVNNAYPVDQWQLVFSGVAGQAVQGVTITSERAVNTLSFSVSTAKPSLAAGDFNLVQQFIEGLQIAELQWGTARAIPAVLRFSIQATAAGTYSFTITSGAADETYIGVFTVTTSGVWQPFVFPIPAVTVGTWAKDNTKGMVLRFTHCCGTGSIGVLGWQAGASLFAGPGQINAAATANQSLNIADVGLYADPSATGLAPPFVIPEIVPEMAKCQRYYSTTLVSAQSPVAGPMIVPWYAPVSMRVLPTLAVAIAGSISAATAAQDAVNDVRGGYFQISATAVNGYVLNRGYKLIARM